jgi:Arf-GAP/GTPase/ANK repeat/PH domain-containing protein 1/3
MMGSSRGSYIPYMSNSHAIRQEIQRFESVHPSIYAIYDLIELVPDPHLAQQIREHVVCIEGRSEISSTFFARFRSIGNFKRTNNYRYDSVPLIPQTLF